MKRKTIIAVIVLFVSLISCNHVQDNIKKMMGRTVNVPFESMNCWLQDSVLIDKEGYYSQNYKYVIYMDSSICSSCNLKQLQFWNDLMDNMSNTQFIFIIAPRHREDIEYIPLYIKKADINCPVYIDKDYLFLKENSFFPAEPLYHTVLLDKNNKIVLVGSPLRNPAIEEIAKTITKTNTKGK